MKRVISSEDSLKKDNDPNKCVLVLYIEGKKIGYLSKAFSSRWITYARCLPEIDRNVKIHKAERWAKQYISSYMCYVSEFYIYGNGEYDYALRDKSNWTLYKNREIVKENADAVIRIEELQLS